MAAARNPEEIRRSIEANRAELGLAVERLRGEVAEVADWRKHLRNNQKQVMIGAAVAGFVLGALLAIPVAAAIQISIREYNTFRNTPAEDVPPPDVPAPKAKPT